MLNKKTALYGATAITVISILVWSNFGITVLGYCAVAGMFIVPILWLFVEYDYQNSDFEGDNPDR